MSDQKPSAAAGPESADASRAERADVAHAESAEAADAPAASGAAATDAPPALKSMKPLDPPTVPFAVGGMVVWLIAWLIAYLAFRDDHPSWPSICIAGFLLGLPGLAIMIVHDRHRRARRSAAQDEASTRGVG